MIIDNHEVPKELIYKYCKVIYLLEKNFDSTLEIDRTNLHNEIFKYVGCDRSLYRREDRQFNLALNNVVFDLCFH